MPQADKNNHRITSAAKKSVLSRQRMAAKTMRTAAKTMRTAATAAETMRKVERLPDLWYIISCFVKKRFVLLLYF